MTQEQKHALIAEKIEDWTDVYVADNGTAWGIPVLSAAIEEVLDYSSDLNLCARAEARIAEMGDRAKQLYLDIRADIAGYDWEFANAPASVRVDAMVALIQSMEKAS